MATGKVKWFSASKGYGFIIPDSGGPDVFTHIRDLRASGLDKDKIKEDLRVTFDAIPGRDSKPKAVNVRLAQ